MKIRHLLPGLAPLILTLILAACGSGDRIVGNGTSSETIAGVFTYEDGKSAAGARALLRRADYLADTATALAKRSAPAQEAVLDERGALRLEGVDTGFYRLEVNDGRGRAVLLDVHVDGRRDPEALRATLAEAASVTGRLALPPGIARAFVQIYGLERVVRVDSARPDFAFIDLPGGAHVLRITVSSPHLAPRDLDTLRLLAGDSTALGPVSALVENYSSWKNRDTLVLNTTPSGADVADNIPGFPLLVPLRAYLFDFSRASADGRDIRFATLDGRPLAYQIEHWDSEDGRADIWVRLDTLYGNRNDQKIILHTGQSAAPDRSEGQAVFASSAGFAAVWHLDSADDSTGSSVGTGGPLYRDATGNGNHCRAEGTGFTPDEGLAGNALMFGAGGTSQLLDCGNDASLGLEGELTLSAWVRLEQADIGRQHPVFSKKDSAGGAEGYGLTVTSGQTETGLDARAADSAKVSGPGNWMDGWHHCAVVFQAGAGRIYFDGVEVASSAGPLPIRRGDQRLLLGSAERGGFLLGTLDEVRVESRARSAAWVKLTYENSRLNQNLVRLLP